MVDRDDDLKIGVKSSAILFADMDRLLIGIMQAMMLFALMLIGRQLKFGNWYLARRRGGGGVLPLSAVADPQSRACRLPPRVHEQSLRRDGDLHRHPARVRLR